ncbi:MAG: ABC transporter permease [Clostridia bacterium]|nr:ABC transporter permease [Clostridia bacterium]
MTQTKTIGSYYHYPLRSLEKHKRAYLFLALSIFCMLILCASVLIFYASRYEADIETLRREYGPQHVAFYDLDPEETPQYTNRSYIKEHLTVPIYASADNPDEYSAFSQVFFTGYDPTLADFFGVRLTAGRLPENMGEIIVSERAARYYPCFTLDEEMLVSIYCRGSFTEVPFRVVGVFHAASSADEYVLTSGETADYLRGNGSRGYKYTEDVYLIFRGNTPTKIKIGMQNLIDDLGMMNKDEKGNAVEIDYNSRNEMLSPAALIRPFYEQETVWLMFLFSVLPAAIALTVFIYLDMQKNIGELASLSMIGATWKQIFRMQILKYGIIFLIVFPFGILAAAGLMGLVCLFANRISPDKVFLWFRFDGFSVFVLFLVCAGILLIVTYQLSKRMTSVSYTEMLSSVHAAGNIFVARTSGLLFAGERMLDRIALLFFTRNRKVNKLFCFVVILLFCIDSFFTMQVSREYGAAPDADALAAADFLLYGDTDASQVFDAMDPTLGEILPDIPGIQEVRRTFKITPFYRYIDDLSVDSDIQKQLVRNDVKDGKFGSVNNQRVWKRGRTDVDFIGMDESLLRYTVGQDVVDGDLSNLYDNEKTIGLVVHGWSSDEKYYHTGDKLALRFTRYDDETESQRSTAWEDYTIGAVIYRPNDDAYSDFITVYVSPDLFTECTGIEDIYSYSVICTDQKEDTLSAVRASMAELEGELHFTVTDTHAVLEQARKEALHTVLYIYIMKFFVMFVAVLLLAAMTHFMLEVKAPSLRAMFLIGTAQKQLMRINILEFLIASAFSSIAGLLLSLIATAAISLKFEITLYRTPMSVLLTALSMIFLTAVNLAVPIYICQRNADKMGLNPYAR